MEEDINGCAMEAIGPVILILIIVTFIAIALVAGAAGLNLGL